MTKLAGPLLLVVAIICFTLGLWPVLLLMCIVLVLLPVQHNPAYWHLVDPRTGELTKEGRERQGLDQ